MICCTYSSNAFENLIYVFIRQYLFFRNVYFIRKLLTMALYGLKISAFDFWIINAQ